MSDDISNEEPIESTVLHAHEAAATREKKDPEVGKEPLSLWAFFLCAVALVAGGGYLGATSGGFNYTKFTAPDYEPTRPIGAGDQKPADPPDVAWRKAGKRVYGTTCMGCHGASGVGAPGKYPPLASSDWVTGGTERLAQVILSGLSGPIMVNGKAFITAEAMSPHKDKLNDEQIAQVMSYIRNEWGNGIETIVTKEQIAEARKRHGDRATAWTASEVAPADAELPGGPAPAGTEAEAETDDEDAPAEPAETSDTPAS